MAKKLKCWKKRYFVIDRSTRKIEGGVSGSPTRRGAMKIKNSLIKSRTKRGQAKYNREFGRSTDLIVEEGQVPTRCKR